MPVAVTLNDAEAPALATTEAGSVVIVGAVAVVVVELVELDVLEFEPEEDSEEVNVAPVTAVIESPSAWTAGANANTPIADK